MSGGARYPTFGRWSVTPRSRRGSASRRSRSASLRRSILPRTPWSGSTIKARSRRVALPSLLWLLKSSSTRRPFLFIVAARLHALLRVTPGRVRARSFHRPAGGRSGSGLDVRRRETRCTRPCAKSPRLGYGRRGDRRLWAILERHFASQSDRKPESEQTPVGRGKRTAPEA